MRNVFIDSNIILDVFLKNPGFWEKSTIILKLCEVKILTGFISSSSVTDLFYIIKKNKNTAVARKALAYILAVFDVINIDKADLVQAYNLLIDDFEDALQSWCADKTAASVIITRNTNDFVNSAVPAILPDDFLQRLISNATDFALKQEELAFIQRLLNPSVTQG
jgi:predicted nucleic acid-binding protein